jgi:Undecaprenyl-phosphate galactose phosphotransferase WbaP
MKSNQKHHRKAGRIQNRNHRVNLILIAVDILAVTTAVILSAAIREILIPFIGGTVHWHYVWNGLIVFVIFTVVSAWFSGLYPGFGLAAVHEMQKVLYVVTLALIVMGIFLFFQQLGLQYSRLIFLLSWIFASLFMMLSRFGIRNLFSHLSWWGEPVVIIGTPEYALPVIERLITNRRQGFRPAFFYNINPQSEKSAVKIPHLCSEEKLRQTVSDKGLTYAVFADPINNETFNFHWIRDVFPNILFVLKSSPFGSLWVRTIDLHGVLVIETNYHLLNKAETNIKRIFDLLLTLILLLVSWPLFLILAVLVKITSRGPAIYSQQRLGVNGETFDSYKFRTMYLGAEQKLTELLESDEQAFLEYSQLHKLTNDPRVTKIGKFLRRYSLDEMPQFINILKGDMNLIGPRSYLPRELSDMGDYAKIVLKVKPGITGWWQVMGRNETTFQERLQLDEYYISNWSLWLDLYIVIKTIWVVLRGKGL